MKLSTKGRYGLKAIFEFSIHANDQYPFKMIAINQNISDQYLEQIFSTLKKSGLINSVRGAQGGYVLVKMLKIFSVGDVLVVLEGPVSLSECIIDEDICENSGTVSRK